MTDVMRVVRRPRNVFSKRHWQKKTRRKVLGLLKPVWCPKCRQYTEQRYVTTTTRACVPGRHDFSLKQSRQERP